MIKNHGHILISVTCVIYTKKKKKKKRKKETPHVNFIKILYNFEALGFRFFV